MPLVDLSLVHRDRIVNITAVLAALSYLADMSMFFSFSQLLLLSQLFLELS
jgi:hypothetical protein